MMYFYHVTHLYQVLKKLHGLDFSDGGFTVILPQVCWLKLVKQPDNETLLTYWVWHPVYVHLFCFVLPGKLTLNSLYSCIYLIHTCRTFTAIFFVVTLNGCSWLAGGLIWIKSPRMDLGCEAILPSWLRSNNHWKRSVCKMVNTFFRTFGVKRGGSGKQHHLQNPSFIPTTLLWRGGGIQGHAETRLQWALNG